MKDIKLIDLASRLGNVKVSELIGVDHVTVWRWVTKKKDIYIEMEEGRPVAIIHRHPIPTHRPPR